MPTFFEVDSSMFKDLAGFYDVVQCTKFRQSNPDGATTFKGNDISWACFHQLKELLGHG
jgi:hypothetical protein